MQAIDTTDSVSGSVLDVLAAGYHGIIRYVSPNSETFPNKQITRAEAADIHSVNGMMIGLCYEYEPATDDYAKQIAYFTAEQAGRDSARALSTVAEIDSPGSVPVFFCTDLDPEAEDLAGAVLDYFSSVHETFGNQDPPRLVGVYGSGATCALLKEKGVVHYTWLAEATGWSGYEAWKDQADILQMEATEVARLSVDTNVVTNPAVLW